MYIVQTYDVNSKNPNANGSWRTRGKRKTKRGTVRLIRKLLTMGYDRETSIYVEKMAG